ncbi:hypothetical protein [Bremerella sp.]|uniref:hypothetical protein n=1 Tax=Bremerella sp. TaxID=2795602 RepID=UPI00391888A9
MRDEIRIRFSVGLIAVAIVHALLLGLVFTALHRKTPTPQPEQSWRVPSRPSPVGPSVGKIEKLQEPQEVNLEAQGELKQQILRRFRRQSVRRCPSPQSGQCAVQSHSVTVVARPTKPVRVEPKGSGTTEVDSTKSFLETAATGPVSSPASPPPKKNYQLALFVGDDAQSQQLKTWFDEDPRLTKLRGSCEYQVYTESNAIYRTRFADIVPAEQFPVVLFQDSTGGHIHAAGRTMIPKSPDELYSDLYQGYELYQQAKKAEKTGAVKSRGYSWDDAISPTLYLSAEDCPDGYCPAEPADKWRPGDRIRDGLFDDVRDTRNALMWVSAGEMATIAMVFVAAVLLGFILIKRGM